MSVHLREGALFADAKGRECSVIGVTSLTAFSFCDPVSGRKFREDGKSAVAPDFDLIREVKSAAERLGLPALEIASVPEAWEELSPESKDPRNLLVSVWCGELGLLTADVDVASTEGPVSIRRAWLDTEAGSIGVFTDFLESTALKRKSGFRSVLDLVTARALEEAYA